MSKNNTKTTALISLWDKAIRIWHLVIIFLLTGLWISAELNAFYIHKILGILMVAAIIFRLFWGMWGGSTSRFQNFIKGPKTIVAYILINISRNPATTPTINAPQAGHNPLGGWSVIAMLFALSVQAGSGLFSVDLDGLNSGPLARFISFDLGRKIANIHDMCFNILRALVGFHVAAIAFYYVVKKTNLVTAMITGSTNRNVIPLKPAARYAIVIGLAISAFIGWGLWQI